MKEQVQHQPANVNINISNVEKDCHVNMEVVSYCNAKTIKVKYVNHLHVTFEGQMVAQRYIDELLSLV